jgi:hypothetical protein
MEKDIEYEFSKIAKQLFDQFGEGLDIQSILFLIGVQELGKGRMEFSKNEKLDVMHIAICTLLSPYGYYEYEGKDADGWPHWKVNEKLPALKPEQQQQIMKQAIVEYFNKSELLN